MHKVLRKTESIKIEVVSTWHGDGALFHRHPEVPVVVVQKLLDGFPALFKHVHQFWKR